ncbi:hypothetical protein BH09BAC2_BH09BAC2_08180 [soil metagenome]
MFSSKFVHQEWGSAIMKYNPTTLNKLEKILEESGYVVRYERGSFQSGYCILENKKVVVLNKFYNTEGRINTLIDIIPQLPVVYEMLTTDSQKMFDEVTLKHIAQEK